MKTIFLSIFIGLVIAVAGCVFVTFLVEVLLTASSKDIESILDGEYIYVV